MRNNFLVFGALAAFGAVFAVALQPSTTERAKPLSAPRVTAVEPSKMVHAAVVTGPALETLKPPVPIVRNGRPTPVKPPSAEPAVDAKPADAQQTDSQQADTPQPDAQQTDAQQADLDKKAAQAAVEADGYKRVVVLGKASNGAWRAKGFRGSTEVTLTVDGTGRVSMD